MDLFLAIVLGTLFGFVLHRVGASNPQYIINMLRLEDFHLMKAILFGIAVSSTLLFTGMSLGLVDAGHLSIKPTYWGVIVGGIILGAGWAIAGYCPGTGVAALGDGRKDAVFFVAGGLAGALIYMLVYSGISETFLMQEILGGKSTLAVTSNEKYVSVLQTISGPVVALTIAVIFTAVAWLLPEKRDQLTEYVENFPPDVQ